MVNLFFLVHSFWPFWYNYGLWTPKFILLDLPLFLIFERLPGDVKCLLSFSKSLPGDVKCLLPLSNAY